MSEVGTTAHLPTRNRSLPLPSGPSGERVGVRGSDPPIRNRSLPLPSGGGWGVGDQSTAQRTL